MHRNCEKIKSADIKLGVIDYIGDDAHHAKIDSYQPGDARSASG